MKPNYDQLIWEACGRPMRIVEEAEKSGGYFQDYEEPIDITLAHVINLIINKIPYVSISINTAEIENNEENNIIRVSWSDGETYRSYGFKWLYVKGGDHVKLKDQSAKTKEAICKVVGVL